MLSKLELWLQVFLAALQAIITTQQHTPSNAIAQARAMADEALQHMPNGMVRETRQVAFGAQDTSSATLDAGGHSVGVHIAPIPVAEGTVITDPTGQAEDDLERARR